MNTKRLEHQATKIMKKVAMKDVPLATPLMLIVAVLCIIGWIAGELSMAETIAYFGVGTGGSGLIGLARNGSNRGISANPSGNQDAGVSSLRN